MTAVMQGASSLVITTGSNPTCNPFPNCTYSKGAFPVDIDWNGGKNQIEKFIEGAGGKKPVFLVSSEAVTQPNNPYNTIGNGHGLFYKLNLEAFLMNAGVPFTIFQPCGLTNGEPLKATLLVGH